MAAVSDQVGEELAATGAAIVAAPCGCASSTVRVASLAAAVVALAITTGSRLLFCCGSDGEAPKWERAKGRGLLSRESRLGALGSTMFWGLAWSAM